jgi:hypothetical protein
MSNVLKMTGSQQRRVVSVNDRPVFDLQWATRNGPGTETERRKGISDESLIEQYAYALQKHFCLLTGPTFGWSEAETSRHTPYPVLITDLGPWILGTATTDGHQLPYLAFSCRNPELSQNPGAGKGSDVVLHELVHLFQFQTDAWRYWPRRNRWGTADPNWWLHEATALAVEAELAVDVSWYPWLWTWATQPQRSLESDATGAMAAPFIQYLMRRFGRPFAASIYRISASSAPTMRGTELLDAAIRVQTTNSQSDDGSRLSELFLDYCVEAVAPLPGQTFLDPSITQIVGRRLMTAHVSELPFEISNSESTIDHLGCRYIEISRPLHGRRFKLELIHPSTGDRCVLHTAVVELDEQGKHLKKTYWRPDLCTGSLSLILSPHELTKSFILTVVNIAHGSGWERFDNLPLQLRIVTDE